MNRLAAGFSALLLALLLVSCAQKEKTGQTEKKLTVAVAASLALPLEEIAREFEKKYGVGVEITLASSGVLTAQIIHGAPFDLFISADAAYPEKLKSQGKVEGRTKVFALGTLAVWSKEELKGLSVKELLTSDHIKTVGIANPDLAPFGAAAQHWLETEGIYQKVQSKLVFGENVGSINQFISSGAVDAAFTSDSARYAPLLQEKGHWPKLPVSENGTVPHVAVIIRQNKPRIYAEQLLEFLSSSTAQAVLSRYGYMQPAAS